MIFPVYETLILSAPAENVLLVTLNRPKAANALNTQMGHDIVAAFGRLEYGSHRCVVLTGAGERVFCAGADLKERNGMSDADWGKQHQLFERAFLALMDCPLPLIAAVNGAAFGGGFEMALACDFIYAAKTARFALPEASLGIMPGGGGTQTLTRIVGPARAKEIILSGVPFTAEEGASWGVVNKVYDGDVLTDALGIASRIARNAPLSLRQVKRAIRAAQAPDLHEGYDAEIAAYNTLVPTEDRREGISAFNEKRKPDFRGR
jgi:enoyl-CoA hydratase